MKFLTRKQGGCKVLKINRTTVVLDYSKTPHEHKYFNTPKGEMCRICKKFESEIFEEEIKSPSHAG